MSRTVVRFDRAPRDHHAPQRRPAPSLRGREHRSRRSSRRRLLLRTPGRIPRRRHACRRRSGPARALRGDARRSPEADDLRAPGPGEAPRLVEFSRTGTASSSITTPVAGRPAAPPKVPRTTRIEASAGVELRSSPRRRGAPTQGNPRHMNQTSPCRRHRGDRLARPSLPADAAGIAVTDAKVEGGKLIVTGTALAQVSRSSSTTASPRCRTPRSSSASTLTNYLPSDCIVRSHCRHGNGHRRRRQLRRRGLSPRGRVGHERPLSHERPRHVPGLELAREAEQHQQAAARRAPPIGRSLPPRAIPVRPARPGQRVRSVPQGRPGRPEPLARSDPPAQRGRPARPARRVRKDPRCRDLRGRRGFRDRSPSMFGTDATNGWVISHELSQPVRRRRPAPGSSLPFSLPSRNDIKISAYRFREWRRMGPFSVDLVVNQLKAAGDETRIRLLALLQRGERTVKELTEILGQSQPRISRHLKVLAEADSCREVLRVPGSTTASPTPTTGARWRSES